MKWLASCRRRSEARRAARSRRCGRRSRSNSSSALEARRCRRAAGAGCGSSAGCVRAGIARQGAGVARSHRGGHQAALSIAAGGRPLRREQGHVARGRGAIDARAVRVDDARAHGPVAPRHVREPRGLDAVAGDRAAARAGDSSVARRVARPPAGRVADGVPDDRDDGRGRRAALARIIRRRSRSAARGCCPAHEQRSCCSTGAW